MTNVQIIKSGNDLQLQTEQLLGTCLQLLSKSKAEILSNYWESHRIKYYLKKIGFGLTEIVKHQVIKIK